jgi:hypothetical protein
MAAEICHKKCIALIAICVRSNLTSSRLAYVLNHMCVYVCVWSLIAHKWVCQVINEIVSIYFSYDFHSDSYTRKIQEETFLFVECNHFLLSLLSYRSKLEHRQNKNWPNKENQISYFHFFAEFDLKYNLQRMFSLSLDE